MRWRLLRLDWAYGIGELVIVVAGVMIALGFEQWNSCRLDHVEEIEIINGFLPDLLAGFPRLRTYNGQIHRMVGIPTMIINTSSGSPIRQ